MTKFDEDLRNNKIIELLKKNLKLDVDSRCAGHMCATEDWLTVRFAGEIVVEVRLRREECEGEWS